ncbi:hypothetical protein BDN71DRAFT_1437427, partial [Pleurotus eryngii]
MDVAFGVRPPDRLQLMYGDPALLGICGLKLFVHIVSNAQGTGLINVSGMPNERRRRCLLMPVLPTVATTSTLPPASVMMMEAAGGLSDTMPTVRQVGMVIETEGRRLGEGKTEGAMAWSPLASPSSSVSVSARKVSGDG